MSDDAKPLDSPHGGWDFPFAEYGRAHSELGAPIGPAIRVPNSWKCAVQESDSHLLIWDGASIHVIVRAPWHWVEPIDVTAPAGAPVSREAALAIPDGAAR